MNRNVTNHRNRMTNGPWHKKGLYRRREKRRPIGAKKHLKSSRNQLWKDSFFVLFYFTSGKKGIMQYDNIFILKFSVQRDFIFGLLNFGIIILVTQVHWNKSSNV